MRQVKGIPSKSKEIQSLKTQIQAILVNEREIMESAHKIQELEEWLERQNVKL